MRKTTEKIQGNKNMNREIKFRGWSYDEKEWMNPATIEVWDKTGVLKAFYGGEYVIEQWTGLKDKNDKEISEGDIIKSEYYDKPAGFVAYNEKTGGYQIDGLDGAPVTCFNFGASPYVVIGNIHENPELLDAKSN